MGKLGHFRRFPWPSFKTRGFGQDNLSTFVQVAREKGQTHYFQPLSQYWRQSQKVEIKPKP